MAWGRNFGDAFSQAANRYCWTNAKEMPPRNVPRQNRAKLPVMMAVKAMRPPRPLMSAPTMEPGRRPSRLSKNAAGMVPQAVPTTMVVTGMVASGVVPLRR